MPNKPSGFRAFLLIWLGQIISVLASGMTAFGLSLWMYDQTRSATAMGLVQVFYITPFLLLSPLAGVWVDRYDRKWMMALSDLAGALATLFLLFMLGLGKLQFWHLYLSAVFNGLGNTFQWPAYSATISLMISKPQLGRANGLMSLMEAGPGVIAPLLAGALLPFVRLQGLLLLDLLTFLLAVGALWLVVVPSPSQSAEGRAAQGSFWREALYGFGYIFQRRSLLGLQIVFLLGNLFSGIAFTVTTPMILARSGQDSLTLGVVETVVAVGSILGGLLMTAWGGFKRRAHGVLLGWFSFGLGMTVFGLGRGLQVWVPTALFAQIFLPLVNASNQAIWQAKVTPDLQGRVFSARRLIAWATNPISPLIGGTLADFLLEPALQPGGGLTTSLGWLTGIGPGAGMGLLMSLCGLGVALIGLGGYLFPFIWRAEDFLPDA